MKNRVIKIMLVLVILLALGSISIYAEETTTSISSGDYNVTNNGVYKLEENYSGTITIKNAVNEVTIIGNNSEESPHTDTQITFEVARTGPAILIIDDLNIIAKEGHHGIDLKNLGNRDNKLYISGSSKIVADANKPTTYDVTYGSGIHVPKGVKLIIDKMPGLTDSEAKLEAVGGCQGAGIGGGNKEAGGTITITGGAVTATGGQYGAGIGGGDGGAGGTITITGGEVTATGGLKGAGIGGGDTSEGGTIEITGGEVTTTGGYHGAGIGGGYEGGGGTITITGGEVTATGGWRGAGIGGGYEGAGGTITITGGEVTATGGYLSAGIGGGYNGGGGTITISGGEVTATGGDDGAGIGGGRDSSGGTIEISGGEVTATGGEYGAGIGGGCYGGGGTITISEGKVTATGGDGGAGIGGGSNGAGGTITIKNNPTIIATKGRDATDIGAGANASATTTLKNESGTNLKYVRIEIKDPATNPITSNAKITINDSNTYTSDSKGRGGIFIDAASSSYNYEVITDDYIGGGVETNVDAQSNRRAYTLAFPVKFDKVETKDVTTYNGVEGVITVSSIQGGYGTYEYSKDNGKSWQNSNVFNGVSAGIYQIKVRDARYTKNMSEPQSVEITQPARVAIIDIDSQDAIIYGGTDGVITVSVVQGGYGTYQYSKDNGASWQNSNIFSGLIAGTYEIKARDKVDTGNVSEMKTVMITQPAIVTIVTVEQKNTTTYGGTDGVITVSAVQGGYGTYQYSKDNGASWQDSNIFSGLIAGTYEIKARDKVDTGNVSEVETVKITQPAIVAVITVEQKNTKTYGAEDGEITVSEVQGGYGTYEYSNDNGASWQDSNIFSGLTAGTYEIKARDEVDTGNISEMKMVEVTEKVDIITVDSQNATTYGGSEGVITVSAIQGGYGTYQYSKDNGASWQESNIFSGLSAGTYEIKARDKVDTGIISEVETVKITQPSKPSSGGSSSTNSSIVKTEDKEALGTKQTTTQNGQKKTIIKTDKTSVDKIIENLKKGENIEIDINDNSDMIELELNMKAIKNMQPKEMALKIQTHQGTYNLPATAIDIETIAQRLGEDIKYEDIKYEDIKLKVKISKPQEENIKFIEEVTKENGLSIIVPSVDFEVWATYKGKEIKVDKMKQMVTRLIPIPKGTDIERITTCVIIEKDGTIRPVPTSIIEKDGQYYAQIKSMTNSIYTLIQSNAAYTDIQGHWAQKQIEKMAEKLVVKGIQKDKKVYNPDEAITREELAKILVKAIALKPEETDQFVDVKKGSEQAKYIGTAYAYGIIKGISQNTFAPDNKITRQDAMTMIYRVAKIIGYEGSEEKINMSKYQDLTSVSAYAKEAVTWNVSNKIINGKTETTLAPEQNITRAEIAVIIDRLLKQAELTE